MLLTPSNFHRAGGFASWMHLCCCCGVTPCPDELQVTFAGVDAGLCTGCHTLSPTYGLAYTSLNVDGTYILPKTADTATFCTYNLGHLDTGIVLDYEVHNPGDCSGVPTINSVGLRVTVIVTKASKRITTIAVDIDEFISEPLISPFARTGITACLRDVVVSTTPSCGTTIYHTASGGTAIVEAVP